MITHPSSKYAPFRPVDLPDRRWPGNVLTQAPTWMSTDLRDGNQALFEPMSVEKKLRLFQTLCAIGFKEIEVAFPSASQTDFDFVRLLIEGGHVPDDVTLVVLTQAREHLIRRTMESLRGAKRAIVHFYVATAPVFREVVFRMTKPEVVKMAVDSVRLIRALAAELPGTDVRLEYSPEVFVSTELEFAKEICDAVVEAAGATPDRRIILNLPATVEVATPNVYADQIEWMHRNLARRDAVILSVHPHNDRGSAVAAAELAMMAGAERVEGCLFGNGERTGNVDLVTLALNLYTQGVAPGLDLSDISQVARVVEDCTQLPIHPRHPYAGDLVFTAFSGSHQDAIKKGFAAAAAASGGSWRIPYLPIDPKDVGRTYDSIIRINGQSGKGGVAYILETVHGLTLPLRLQVELSGAVQRHADATGGEITPDELWRIFSREYLEQAEPIAYLGHEILDGGRGVQVTVEVQGRPAVLVGHGNGPIDALVHALKVPVRLQSYEERSTGVGADSKAAAMVELAVDGAGPRFGVGVHENIVTASVLAVLSAVNRGLQTLDAHARRRVLAPLEGATSGRVHEREPARA
ncbi:MAG TPA: 2-isopropylmalate synthase [Anaeromyxobacter sp.]|nr:2-isopropylmalate synthase [Anaeromyxobacter sp.]